VPRCKSHHLVVVENKTAAEQAEMASLPRYASRAAWLLLMLRLEGV